MSTVPSHRGYLLLPHIHIQNANAVSSPHTWGFPAPTAFTGFMHALQRRLDTPMECVAVGVVCHRCEPQVHDLGWNRPGQFALTRNPVENKRKIATTGQTTPMSIVEEGRVHLEVSLLIALAEQPPPFPIGPDLSDLANTVASMRIAGGSIRSLGKPVLQSAGDTEQEQAQRQRVLRRQLLPGFALVNRPDILRERIHALQAENPKANALDAIMDLSALTYRSHLQEDGAVEWAIESPGGWFVPVPLGYAAISEKFAPGQVKNARDDQTPFQFVESLIGVGQWVSPHRLRELSSLLWYPHHDPDSGTYLCQNHYSA